MSFTNDYDHIFIQGLNIEERYYRCKKCDIICYTRSLKGLGIQLVLSQLNDSLKDYHNKYLKLTCNEIIIKRLLE